MNGKLNYNVFYDNDFNWISTVMQTQTAEIASSVKGPLHYFLKVTSPTLFSRLLNTCLKRV